MQSTRNEQPRVVEEERRTACRRPYAGATFASDERGWELEIGLIEPFCCSNVGLDGPADRLTDWEVR